MRDECFIRGQVPMTKSEVRAVVLSKLELQRSSVLYDIGAGTGSVSIEAAKVADQGMVYAIEQKEAAVALILENKKKFGVDNLSVIKGIAPEAMRSLPIPTHAFIGGSSGNLNAIMKDLQSLNKSIRIVMTMIALETITQVVEYLKLHELEAEIVSVQIAKAERMGSYHLMQGQNPVTIITFGGEPDER